jgi:hypothetical protein
VDDLPRPAERPDDCQEASGVVADDEDLRAAAHLDHVLDKRAKLSRVWSFALATPTHSSFGRKRRADRLFL